MTLVVKHPPGINNGEVGHTAMSVCLCVFASHFMIDTNGDPKVSVIGTLFGRPHFSLMKRKSSLGLFNEAKDPALSST